YSDTKSNSMSTEPGLSKSVEINVFDGIKMQVNIQGDTLFKGIDVMMQSVSDALNNPTSTGKEIGGFLGDIQGQTNIILEQRAVIGARQNRVELMENRLSISEVNITKQISVNEDTDYAKTITEMTTAEAI